MRDKREYVNIYYQISETLKEFYSEIENFLDSFLFHS